MPVLAGERNQNEGRAELLALGGGGKMNTHLNFRSNFKMTGIWSYQGTRCTYNFSSQKLEPRTPEPKTPSTPEYCGAFQLIISAPRSQSEWSFKNRANNVTPAFPDNKKKFHHLPMTCKPHALACVYVPLPLHPPPSFFVTPPRLPFSNTPSSSTLQSLCTSCSLSYNVLLPDLLVPCCHSCLKVLFSERLPWWLHPKKPSTWPLSSPVCFIFFFRLTSRYFRVHLSCCWWWCLSPPTIYHMKAGT